MSRKFKRYLARRTRSLSGDEQGAVLLMCLGGILAVLLMAMMVYDAGMVTKDKTRVQGAADFSAMSQASVNARSMNMMAYANIAKRSVWAAHSLYPAHIRAYRDWILDELDDFCDFDGSEWMVDEDSAGEGGFEDDRDPDDIDDHDKCAFLVLVWLEYVAETRPASAGVQGDFHTFSGADYSDPDPSNEGTPIVPDAGGMSANYFAEDLRAIDHYQRYVVGSTPWWGWTEQLMTGIRNGATLTATFPPPPAGPASGFDNFDSLEQFTNNPINPGETGPGDYGLPVQPGVGGMMATHIADRIDGGLTGGGTAPSAWNDIDNMQGGVDDMFLLEHLANNALLVTRSTGIYNCEGIDELDLDNDHCRGFAGEMADVAWVDAVHEDFLDTGLDYSQEAFSLNNPDHLAEPWTLDGGLTSSEWLSASSNLVIAYKHDMGRLRGERGRSKFDFVGGDPEETEQFYERGGGPMAASRQRDMYSALGYWGMARGEVSFTGGAQPNLWEPVWISKLRPVSLPGEYQNQPGYEMEEMYHAMLPYLRLAQQMGLSDMDPVDSIEHRWDFARMEWMMRSMSDSTVEGVPK